MKTERQIALISLLILLVFTTVYSQAPAFKWGVWNQLSLNGAISLEGQYRSQETVLRSNITERPRTSLLNGQFLLNSRSYIWHPNFMLVDMDFDFEPGRRRDQYVVIPDRSEVRTAEQAHLRTTFFNQRPMMLSLFSNFNHNYISRELITNIETYKTDLGGLLSFQNPVLPASLRYLWEKWDQKEIQTGRRFKNRRKSFQSEFNKSFSGRDDHQLRFSYNDYRREYGNRDVVDNKISEVTLRDKLFFTESETGNFNSFLWYYHQTGNERFDRFQAFENFILPLPEKFRLLANYQYSWFDQQTLHAQQHNVTSRLEHKLFLSLRSQAFYEYSYLSQSAYNELINIGGLAFDYQKQIPTGTLLVNYEFRRRHQSRSSVARTLRIANEDHRLIDGEVVLLNNPFIDIKSLVVTDATGTIIYLENIDYILVARGSYLEIQRLPGGQIESGQSVLVDYTAQQQISYRFDTFNNNLGINLNLFRNLFDVYFRYFEQDYENVFTTDARLLKFISQRVFGIRTAYSLISAGFETDDYNSNLVPYNLKRYYLTISGNVAGKVNLMLTAAIRDYLLTESNERQKFNDLSGRVGLQVWRRSKLTLEGGYRMQDGRGIDLTLSTIRTEFSTFYRKVILTLGYEAYHRDFSGEKVNYNGMYFRLTRQF